MLRARPAIRRSRPLTPPPRARLAGESGSPAYPTGSFALMRQIEKGVRVKWRHRGEIRLTDMGPTATPERLVWKWFSFPEACQPPVLAPV